MLTILALTLTNCSKSIYIQSDELGTSKYVIYKDNYKYVEKTKHTGFKIWGKYYLTDSTIVFELRDMDKIPYNYLVENIKKYPKNANSELMSIAVIDKQTNEPVPFASIGAKNKMGGYVTRNVTNFKGLVELRKNEEIEVVEIESIGYGYPKQIIDYKSHQDYNLLIEMEELKSGGRMSGECLITFLDFLLEYRIQNKSDFDEFERNGIVFMKEINTP